MTSTSSRHPRNSHMLSFDDLRVAITADEVDTVIVAFTDMQGRLQGKYLQAHYFLEHALGHGVEGCNYLLAVDTDMNTVDGYAISSWEAGYGDMVFELDLDTIRPIPWLERTVMIQCDLHTTDGKPVPMSPRSMLRAQMDKAAEHGWNAVAGTELEFMVYQNIYEDAWNRDYRGGKNANIVFADADIAAAAAAAHGAARLRRIRSCVHRGDLRAGDQRAAVP